MRLLLPLLFLPLFALGQPTDPNAFLRQHWRQQYSLTQLDSLFRRQPSNAGIQYALLLRLLNANPDSVQKLADAWPGVKENASWRETLRGAAIARVQDPDRRLQHLQNAVAADPKARNLIGWVYLIEEYAATARHTQADSLWRKMQRLNPDHRYLLGEFAGVLLYTATDTRFQTFTDSALRVAPTPMVVARLRALQLSKATPSPENDSLAQAVVRMAPHMAMVRLPISDYLAKRSISQAIQLLQEGIQQDSLEPMLPFFQALFYNSLRDYQRSVPLLEACWPRMMNRICAETLLWTYLVTSSTKLESFFYSYAPRFPKSARFDLIAVLLAFQKNDPKAETYRKLYAQLYPPSAVALMNEIVDAYLKTRH